LLKSRKDEITDIKMERIKSFFVRGFFKKTKGIKNLAIGIIEKIIPIWEGEK
jgi:hypothetical protein